MTEFNRRGHFKTNANGTRYWVSGHTVERRYYSLTTKRKDHFVDDDKPLLREMCKYCYQTVYYASLRPGQRIFFNALSDPLTIHNCQKEKASDKTAGSLSVPSRYLQPHEVEALQIRAEEVMQKRETNKLLSDRASEEENKRKNFGKRISKKAKKVIKKQRNIRLREIEKKQKREKGQP